MAAATTAEKKPRQKKAPATAGGTTPATKRTMSDEHKVSIAEGREEARAVRRYLEALEAHKPKRGRKVTPETMKARIDKIDAELADGPNPLQRLLLNQERKDITEAIENFGDEGTVDLSELEKEFVKVGKRFANKKGIDKSLLRQAGVPAEILKQAGIS